MGYSESVHFSQLAIVPTLPGRVLPVSAARTVAGPDGHDRDMYSLHEIMLGLV